jgi:hypothetical protein
MKIKRLHASFLISTGSYNNERIGFSVELESGETIESVVDHLRERAITIIGQTAQQYYDNIRQYQRESAELERIPT